MILRTRINLSLLKENKQELLLIVLTGYFVLFTSLFNGFVLDDLFQIENNSNIVGWHNIFHFFTHEIGPYYRPLMLTTFSIFHNLGLSSFFYHFLQVSLHILNSIMVFILFKSFLNKKQLSLILSLIFLVHPINVEAVVYVSELQETYFMFFGLLATLFIRSELLEKFFFIIIPIIQMLSLLSKETALIFILIQMLLAYLFHKKYFLKVVVSSVGVILTYITLRLLLFGSITSHKFQTVIPNSPSTASFTERLINIPNIILFYIKTFLFPKDLAVSQLWWSKTLDVNNFYLPLLVDLTALFLLFLFGIYIYKKNKENFKIFIFLSFWLLFGLGLHSQIISLDWTVAERWFYFPMIGLLGLIGIGLKGVDFKRNNLKIKIVIALAITILILFSLRTIIRNANWYDQLTLTSHDIKISKNSGDLELNLGIALNKAGRYQEAIKHLERSSQLIPQGFTIWDALGSAYGNSKQYDKAVSSFKKAINLNKNYHPSYVNLTKVYLLDLKADSAKQFLEKDALKKWPNDAYFWRLLGFANVLLKDNDGALKAFEKAYNLSPNELNSYYYFNLKEGKEVMLRI